MQENVVFAFRGGISRFLGKFVYLKIHRRYGCYISPNAVIGKGFKITHPVGIVIGDAKIGEEFTIYPNTVIGVKHWGDEAEGHIPKIGNNVSLCAGSIILGNISICDNVIIGANSLVTSSIVESGIYCGSPVKRIGEYDPTYIRGI